MEEIITGTEAMRRYGTDTLDGLREYFIRWDEYYNAGNVKIFVESLGGGLFKLTCQCCGKAREKQITMGGFMEHTPTPKREVKKNLCNNCGKVWNRSRVKGSMTNFEGHLSCPMCISWDWDWVERKNGKLVKIGSNGKN